MRFRVIKTSGQKMIHEADAAEISKVDGKLTLWNFAGEARPAPEVVASYESTEWHGLERYNAAAIKPCNCGH